MKLKEFNEAIDRCIEGIESEEFSGACRAINSNLPGNLVYHKANSEFNRLLCPSSKPGYDGLQHFFLGSPQAPESIARRVTALEMFRQTCISFELYKEF